MALDFDFWIKFVEKLSNEMQNAMKMTALFPEIKHMDYECFHRLRMYSLFEMAILNMINYLDEEKECIDLKDNFILPKNGPPNCIQWKLCSCIYEFAVKFKKLKLTPREVRMFTRIVFYNPSKPYLAELDGVSEMRNRTIIVLEMELKKSHPGAQFQDSMKLIDKVLSLIDDLKKVEEVHFELVVETAHLAFKCPDLYRLAFFCDHV